MQEGKEQQDFLREGMATAKRLQKQIEKWELQSLLGGEYDEGGALLSIQVAPPTQRLQTLAPHFVTHSEHWTCEPRVEVCNVSLPAACHCLTGMQLTQQKVRSVPTSQRACWGLRGVSEC